MNKFYKLKKITFVFIISILVFSYGFSFASADTVSVYLGGNVLGFTVQTEGATVVSTCDVITQKGLISPSKNAGLLSGDVILSMNGEKVNSASEVNEQTVKSNGDIIVLEYSRNSAKKLCNVIPVKDVNGVYKLGLFVQDDLSGLGTVTYYNHDGSFASLGHPVTNEKGETLSVISGKVYSASVVGINKPVGFKAGELRGAFLTEKGIGKVNKNTKVGLYGKIEKFNKFGYKLIECGVAKIGKAQIYSTISGTEPKFYDIEIVKADHKNLNNKNLVIKITDKELLSETGGILQGMSGSPIIQNDKLVGAVTHVFLNDSSRGFGIDISKMME